MENIIRLPRILLTNDDGIDAKGMAILEESVSPFAEEVWVVAPEFEQSGASQAVSIGSPVKFTKRGEKRFAVRGTPSDCVLMALGYFMKDARPSLLISGINRGTNHGDALAYSGTVGAALTGLMFNVPSIAISQCYTSRENVMWETSRAIAPKCLAHFIKEGWKKDTCLSLNIPDQPADNVTGIGWARLSRNSIARWDVIAAKSPRNEDFGWLSLIPNAPEEGPDTESSVLARGKVSAVAITLDRSLEVLKPSVKFADQETEPTKK